MRSITLTLILLVLGGMTALAQDSDVKNEFMSALETLEHAPSYHFTYRIMPSGEVTSPISGEGRADHATGSWHYTLQSEPSDPKADRSKDGEWIIADGNGIWYHNSGAGWTTGNMDFTSVGIVFLIGAFTAYDTFELFAGFSEDPDALQELALVGYEVLDGMEAAHYQFAIKEMPAYGSGLYDAWVSYEGDTLSRVILAATTADGHTNRVTFSQIGEPLSIMAPQ